MLQTGGGRLSTDGCDCGRGQAASFVLLNSAESAVPVGSGEEGLTGLCALAGAEMMKLSNTRPRITYQHLCLLFAPISRRLTFMASDQHGGYECYSYCVFIRPLYSLPENSSIEYQILGHILSFFRSHLALKIKTKTAGEEQMSSSKKANWAPALSRHRAQKVGVEVLLRACRKNHSQTHILQSPRYQWLGGAYAVFISGLIPTSQSAVSQHRGAWATHWDEQFGVGRARWIIWRPNLNSGLKLSLFLNH